jgi:dipeptidyl aminopeptidase/acylaminoacyl peptidase
MFPGWHNRGYYWKTYAFNQYLASRGYAVLSINFRSGIGYVRDFRMAENRRQAGTSEYQDLLAGVDWLLERGGVDPDRVGLWGGSYGGYLTQLGLGMSPEIFRTGVNIHGVHDWNLRAELPPWATERRTIPRDETWDVRHRSSPVAWVEDMEGSVLLITGDDDRNVRFLQTIDLVERMRRAGKRYELLVFPDEVHSFLLHENWEELFNVSADFLERELRGAVRADDGG